MKKITSIFCSCVCNFLLSFFLETQAIDIVADSTETSTNAASMEVSKPFSIGINGGLSRVWNNAKLPFVPDSPECGMYTKGKDNGFFFGLSFGYELSMNFLSLDIRAMFDSRPVALSEYSSNNEVFDEITQKYVPLLLHHQFTGTLNYFSFEVGVRIRPVATFPIYLHPFFDAGEPVFKSDISNIQEIVSPEGKLFPNNSTIQINDNGKLRNSTTSFGIGIGLMAEFMLNNEVSIFPEISYRYGLNSIVKNEDWKVNIARAGLCFQWYFNFLNKENKPPLPPPNPEFEMPILQIPPPSIAEATSPIQAFELFPLEIDQTIVTQTYPLLPYIFFDSASAKLRERYTPSDFSSENFDEQLLPKETLGIYYHLLDIIGNRLKAAPEATLTITGTSDGIEFDSLKLRQNLAKQRAVAVAEYLHSKWGVENSRLIIRFSNTPELPTSLAYREGFEENRRVELTSSDPMLLKPVIHSRFLEFNSNQKEIICNVKIDSSIKIKGSEISFHVGNTRIAACSADSLIRSVPINTAFIKAITSNTSSDAKLTAELIIKTDEKTFKENSPLNLNKTENMYEIGRLNLIVFDFDKSVISQQNKNMIDNFIENSIHLNSLVSIQGSTDKLGELDYNLRLSFDRAKSVHEYLLKLKPKLDTQDIKGIGSSDLQYDNSLPEGRFYCRTVLIEVKTPLNEIKK